MGGGDRNFSASIPNYFHFHHVMRSRFYFHSYSLFWLRCQVSLVTFKWLRHGDWSLTLCWSVEQKQRALGLRPANSECKACIQKASVTSESSHTCCAGHVQCSWSAAILKKPQTLLPTTNHRKTDRSFLFFGSLGDVSKTVLEVRLALLSW